MAAPTYKDIRAYMDALMRVKNQSARAFQAAFRAIDFEDWTTAAELTRQLVTRTVDYYGLAAAELGAEWYEYCRRLSIGGNYEAIVKQPNREHVLYDANEEIDNLFAGKKSVDIFEKDITFVVTGQVSKMARDTVLDNLDLEYRNALSTGNKSFAKKCGYARVPVGETCAFCIMLASQGFVYRSEQTALFRQDGNKYHRGCDCQAVPFSDAKNIPGYGDTLDKYNRMYRDADNMRRSADKPEALQKRIDDARAAHNAKYKAGEVSDKWNSANELTIIMRYQNPQLIH